MITEPIHYNNYGEIKNISMRNILHHIIMPAHGFMFFCGFTFRTAFGSNSLSGRMENHHANGLLRQGEETNSKNHNGLKWRDHLFHYIQENFGKTHGSIEKDAFKGKRMRSFLHRRKMAPLRRRWLVSLSQEVRNQFGIVRMRELPGWLAVVSRVCNRMINSDILHALWKLSHRRTNRR